MAMSKNLELNFVQGEKVCISPLGDVTVLMVVSTKLMPKRNGINSHTHSVIRKP